jgi:hypothetical protein
MAAKAIQEFLQPPVEGAPVSTGSFMPVQSTECRRRLSTGVNFVAVIRGKGMWLGGGLLTWPTSLPLFLPTSNGNGKGPGEREKMTDLKIGN